MNETQALEIVAEKPQELMRRATDVQFAWAAGFIDGEGCLGIFNERDKRKGNSYTHFRPSIQVSNSNLESLKSMKRILFNHGTVMPLGKRRPRHKPVHQYSIRRQIHIVEILFALLPYFVTKRVQAEHLLAFCISRQNSSGKGRYHKFTANEKLIFQVIKHENKRGSND